MNKLTQILALKYVYPTISIVQILYSYIWCFPSRPRQSAITLTVHLNKNIQSCTQHSSAVCGIACPAWTVTRSVANPWCATSLFIALHGFPFGSTACVFVLVVSFMTPAMLFNHFLKIKKTKSLYARGNPFILFLFTNTNTWFPEISRDFRPIFPP